MIFSSVKIPTTTRNIGTLLKLKKAREHSQNSNQQEENMTNKNNLCHIATEPPSGRTDQYSRADRLDALEQLTESMDTGFICIKYPKRVKRTGVWKRILLVLVVFVVAVVAILVLILVIVAAVCKGFNCKK